MFAVKSQCLRKAGKVGKKLKDGGRSNYSVLASQIGWVELRINILKFALQVFWYRRYEIHSPSPRQVPVFLVNLTQI